MSHVPHLLPKILFEALYVNGPDALSQSHRSAPQTTEQSASSAQLKPDGTSLPGDPLCIQESQI